MDLRYSFEYEGSSRLGKIYRPVVKVSLKSPNSSLWTSLWMVIDTGADFSILPNHFSNDLDISLDKDCWQDSTSGVGGNQTIYLYKKRLEAKLDNINRSVPIAFFDNDDVPPLLGRLGFLETFDVEFLKSHTVVFKS